MVGRSTSGPVLGDTVIGDGPDPAVLHNQTMTPARLAEAA